MLFYTKNSCIFATEMKVLFLVYHGFSAHSGISKKIHYQVKGLRESGHDVRLCYYDFADNGHRCRYVDDVIIKDYGKGAIAGLRQRLDYNCIYDYCVREKIEFDTSHPQYIETIWGVGYRFRA